MSETKLVTALEVVATLPPTPLVLVNYEFMEALAFCEVKTGDLKITDQASAQIAGGLLSHLTSYGAMLEKARKTLKEPFLEIGRKIDTAATVVANRIDFSKRVLKNNLATFQEIELAKVQEMERLRKAELARLEEQRLREAFEAEEKARKLAATAKQSDLDLDVDLDLDLGPPEKTETEKKIEAVKFAPAPVVAKPTGVRSTLLLKFEVTDVTALPEPFVLRTANERKIRETYCTGWKEGNPIPTVPGVTFSTVRDIQSTGRSTQPEQF